MIYFFSQSPHSSLKELEDEKPEHSMTHEYSLFATLSSPGLNAALIVVVKVLLHS